MNEQGKKVLIQLDAESLVEWLKIPISKRSAYVRNHLKLDLAERKKLLDRNFNRFRGLKMGERENKFRLVDNEGVYWVNARHPDLDGVDLNAVLIVCPRCACAYEERGVLLDSNISPFRAYCHECREETRKNATNAGAESPCF